MQGSVMTLYSALCINTTNIRMASLTHQPAHMKAFANATFTAQPALIKKSIKKELAKGIDPQVVILRARLLQTGEQPLQAGRSRPNATTGKVESFSAETRLAADQNYDQTQPNEERSDSEMSAEEGDIQQFVIPDEPTLPIQKLEPEEALERMLMAVHPHADMHFHAFFSSELGGIVTEPAFMTIHMDDHLVHRGHGVFDTALVVDGRIYMLDRHLERLIHSAAQAGLELPFSLAQLKRAIVETVAYSKKMNGMLRYWVGAGRGGFGISPQECLSSSFYCIMTTLKEGSPTLNPSSDYLRGRRVKTSPIPAKHPYFAIIKSNNYLHNVLATMDAEAEKKDYGIFLDDMGNVAEGPTMNVAILTNEGELVIPPFDQALPGITLLRLAELVEQNLDSLREETQGALSSITQRPFTKFEAYDCREAFLIGSTTYVTGIVQWDEKNIGEGATGDEPGIISLILRRLIKQDMEPLEAPRENFTEVDYGIMTNME